jgi:hypothetical protein
MIVLARAAAGGATEKARRLLENGILHSPRGLFDTEERRGIPKRYGRGLYSTRGPRLFRYLGLHLMNSFLGEGVKIFREGRIRTAVHGRRAEGAYRSKKW